MRSENFTIGISELQTNKLRTFLTMLGIVFGVGAVIAMLSIGEGAKQETLEQIELLGTNNIIIKAKQLKPGKGSEESSFSPGLNIKDSYSIKELNPLIEYITPQREGMYNVTYKSSIEELKIVGTISEYPQAYNSQISEGMFFNESHMDSYANVCVIGSGVKKKFFKYENPVDKLIKIDDVWFRIIGIVESKKTTGSSKNFFGITDFDNEIYIPFTTMVYKIKKYTPPGAGVEAGDGFIIFFDGGNLAEIYDRVSVQQLTVKVKKEASIREAAFLIERILNRRHYGVEDYEVIVPEQLLEQKQKTQRIFNIVMGAIAGISLLVGGIGIMNIMLANILERTREIGIRRAVGATRKDILTQFMYEAITISIIGGVLGIFTGYVITKLISNYAGWRTIITPYSVVLAFFVSALVGFIFGSYPAKKAADKDPIESLRYE